ncbi:hypothetical protein F542_900 [Bibersteinia trehalosi USDA-ARS-USMARC-188]|uniref:Uncharacterized protein n=2 Tax=Bibersteinia trehalosi TaxID=47735 RepID=A0A4V7I712_BIBTR|nr:hypothetical protein WQG_21700 [Bibersteinia trehalosi USDA-ARS-USMARC-192]AHG80808.1 hypothetical protein F542_900 [Bibersteinia trehalosi USDA-ARS-USMARC-188]AHG82957.1 hypothetical protein F543_930 [Bibersteinia trehalosi USDA-ARS-USMARC-189]
MKIRLIIADIVKSEKQAVDFKQKFANNVAQNAIIYSDNIILRNKKSSVYCFSLNGRM